VWAALVFITGGFIVVAVGVIYLGFMLLTGGVHPIENAIAVFLIGFGGLAAFHGFRSLVEPGSE
jgi:hypothetical protein